ncbi:MAG TPA: hypothetical protein VJR89_38845 [Polyangiales bacterium]|nr:hypothetical protein [Polyangiales bacterium]
MRCAWVSVLVLCWMLWPACGDDDDAPAVAPDAGTDAAAVDAGPPESGVAADSKLSDLSDEDAGRVCAALSRRFDRVLSPAAYRKASCTQQAWPVSFDFSNTSGELMGSPPRCEMLVQMCLDQGGALGDFTPTASLGADLVDRARCTEPGAGLDLVACEATVGDLEACGAAVASELTARLPRETCDALADPQGLERASMPIDLAQLPACQPLQERCPGFSIDTQPDGRAPMPI